MLDALPLPPLVRALGRRVIGRAARPAAAPSAGRVPEVRPRSFLFVKEPLLRVRHVPEVQLIAVTSLLSTPAERLVIAALSEAAPRIADRELVQAIEAFLEQESNHIAAHAPLNRLLLEEIYPHAGRLRRLGEEMLVRHRGRALEERLAVAAAYEYASDAIFGAVYEEHYRIGRRFHHDPEVHEALLASNVGPLFSWHALEELSHRHVAFEAALALGVSPMALRLGMVRVVAELARLQFPAAFELIRGEPHAHLTDFLRAVLIEPGFVRLFGGRLARWMEPGFDPAGERYPFFDALADDVGAP